MEGIIAELAYGVTINKKSYYHPWEHTERVAEYAKMIMSKEFDYSILSEVLISAYFHDTGRLSEPVDYEHGYRSAMLLDMNVDYIPFDFDLESVRFAVLNHCHKTGETGWLPIVSNYPRNLDKRIAACLWDADRLDLLRNPKVDRVRGEFLNTDYAKSFANSREHFNYSRYFSAPKLIR